MRPSGLTFVKSLLSKPSPQTLPGTVPYHQLYILLHTFDPPTLYPAKKSSDVQRALQLEFMKLGGLVNFSWSSSESLGERNPEEQCCATAFSASRGQLDIPLLSMANVSDIAETLKNHMLSVPDHTTMKESDVHLYVCTHGARDCRCGEMGGVVVEALRTEVAKRRALNKDVNSPIHRVMVSEVGHVGGHKFAANLLVYPHGEWLGEVKPQHVPEILDNIMERPSIPATSGDPPLCIPHWRGRMGLTKEEQITLWNSH